MTPSRHVPQHAGSAHLWCFGIPRLPIDTTTTTPTTTLHSTSRTLPRHLFLRSAFTWLLGAAASFASSAACDISHWAASFGFLLSHYTTLSFYTFDAMSRLILSHGELRWLMRFGTLGLGGAGQRAQVWVWFLHFSLHVFGVCAVAWYSAAKPTGRKALLGTGTP